MFYKNEKLIIFQIGYHRAQLICYSDIIYHVSDIHNLGIDNMM